VQAGAFAVDRLRCDIVFGPDVVENKGQQYGKNYAELQEDRIADLVIAAKPVMVNDPVQQRAYQRCYEPNPDDQPAEFCVRHYDRRAAISAGRVPGLRRSPYMLAEVGEPMTQATGQHHTTLIHQ